MTTTKETPTKVTSILERDEKVIYTAEYDFEDKPQSPLISQTYNDPTYEQESKEALLSTTQDTSERDAAAKSGGLDIAKFVWDIIKDNKPTGTTKNFSTSILNSSDPNPMNYGNAVRGKSGSFTWTVRDSLIKSIVYLKIVLRIAGTYNARNPKVPGAYIPDLHVTFDKCDVSWPVSATGKANVTKVSNMGSISDPNPSVDIICNLKASWAFQEVTATVTYRATGRNGFMYVSKS